MLPVLDLYAGAGLFALTLAKRGHTVTAVEENREAVADGQASQRLNRIPDEPLPVDRRPGRGCGEEATRGRAPWSWIRPARVARRASWLACSASAAR